MENYAMPVNSINLAQLQGDNGFFFFLKNKNPPN